MSAITKELQERISELESLLRELEWGGAETDNGEVCGEACPMCQLSRREGHEQGCRLSEAIHKYI